MAAAVIVTAEGRRIKLSSRRADWPHIPGYFGPRHRWYVYGYRWIKSRESWSTRRLLHWFKDYNWEEAVKLHERFRDNEDACAQYLYDKRGDDASMDTFSYMMHGGISERGKFWARVHDRIWRLRHDASRPRRTLPVKKRRTRR